MSNLAIECDSVLEAMEVAKAYGNRLKLKLLPGGRALLTDAPASPAAPAAEVQYVTPPAVLAKQEELATALADAADKEKKPEKPEKAAPARPSWSEMSPEETVRTILDHPRHGPDILAYAATAQWLTGLGKFTAFRFKLVPRMPTTELLKGVNSRRTAEGLPAIWLKGNNPKGTYWTDGQTMTYTDPAAPKEAAPPSKHPDIVIPTIKAPEPELKPLSAEAEATIRTEARKAADAEEPIPLTFKGMADLTGSTLGAFHSITTFRPASNRSRNLTLERSAVGWLGMAFKILGSNLKNRDAMPSQFVWASGKPVFTNAQAKHIDISLAICEAALGTQGFDDAREAVSRSKTYVPKTSTFRTVGADEYGQFMVCDYPKE